MQLMLIITQSLVLPLALSFLLFGLNLRNEWIRSAGLISIWLLVYFWIRGIPPLLPAEAMDWVWLFSIAMLLCFFIRPFLWRGIAYTFVFTISLIIYAWPVLRYQFSAVTVIEIVTVGVIAAVIFLHPGQKSIHNPALVISTSAGGLALVAALAGSLLVGQLAGALAASVGGFALFELLRRKLERRLSAFQLSLLVSIYLALLYIGRVYAELPMFSIALLALSPLCGVFIPWRLNWLVSVLFSATAVVWVLFSADSSSGYY